MNISKLKTELLAGHPVTGAYDANDATAASEINALNVNQNRTTMTGSEILNAINVVEFDALVAADKQSVWDVIHLGDIDPFGVEATIMTNAFGGGSTTITALAAARKTSISRATELGLGSVGVHHITLARAL